MPFWKYSLLTIVLLIFTGCASEPAEMAPAETPPPASEGPSTPGLAERGLTGDEFPRLREIAENVYVFETLGRNYATNSLVVVTSDGVLVAGGQGNPDTVTLMLEEIARVTDQSVTNVVVASEHGDHTGGNSAFPEEATFFAHPNSQAALERAANSPDREADDAPIIVPAETVTDNRTLTMGATEVQILHLGRSHTGGDLIWSTCPRQASCS